MILQKKISLIVFRSSVEMTVQNGATIFTISIILTTRWQKTMVLSPVLYTVIDCCSKFATGL